MKLILKHFGKNLHFVLLIILLLIARAWCDLELPAYTADIVNVGVGAEYQAKIIPENQLPPDIPIDGKKYFAFMPVFDTGILDGDTITMVGKLTDSSGNVMSSGYLFPEGDTATIKDGKFTMSKTGFVGEIAADGTIILKTANKTVLQKDGKIMLLISLAMIICMFLTSFLSSKTAARIAFHLRESVFKKVIGFSNAEIDKFSIASLTTRCTNDITQLQQFLIMLLSMVLYAPIIAVGGIIKVSKTTVSMTWIIAVAVGALFLIVIFLLVVAMPKFRKIQPATDELTLVGRDILTGLLVIRAFSREEHETKRFEKANRDLTNIQLFIGRCMSVMMPMIMLVMNLIVVLIVWVGAHKVNSGNIQIGDMIAFISYAMQIIFSFLMITMISIMAPRAMVCANRISEVLDTVSKIHDPKTPVKPTEKAVTELAFKNVSFNYGGEEEVLTDINFTAKSGETIAIIGSTGAGKSTLINLIPRLYDATGGEITLNDVNIKDYTQKDLRDLIGLVPQKSVLFSGTIESNLKYADNVSDEDMFRVAKISQAEKFIEEKPEKYAEAISQGGKNVSGGQKQRLAIARALAKKTAKIFIFDDSFSALDYTTDENLRKSLKSDEEIKNAVVIIVAQRIVTIQDADKIIVLDEGKIAGLGKHEELLKDCEVYREIAKSQEIAVEEGGE